MDRWHSLFSRFEAALDEHERRRTAAQFELERFDAWCADTQERVMDQLRGTLTERAAEFDASGPGLVVVTHCAAASSAFYREGISLRVVSVRMGGSVVDLYSCRSHGGVPWIHYSHRWVRDSRPTLVPMVGGVVVRSPQGFNLQRPSRDGNTAKPTTVDDIAFRAIQLLLTAEQARLLRPAAGACG